MKAIAELSQTYFPKVEGTVDTHKLDISLIVIPPVRLQQLRSFLNNPSAQFTCPEQAVLLEVMVRRTQSVLGVLGTGFGKTFIILMQAWLQKPLVTIVVLPLSTLHDDLKRRANDLKVSYSRWSPKGKYNPDVNVISVSIEHLGFPEFIRFMRDLEHQGRLGPFVFDEIHKVITDSDYRDAFKNVRAFHEVKAVIFGLTGSLPPSLFNVLCALTSVTWKVLRTPSYRKELKYQVVRVSAENEMNAAIVEHLHRSISSYRPEDRAMVFCRSKQHVTTLACLFKTHPYCAPGDNDTLLEKNKEAMIKWISGDNKVMTSTSILGCGIDYSHVRDIIHRDPSFTMLDQYQEDSRGGRDGLQCRATTFIVDRKKYQFTNQPYDLGGDFLLNSLGDTSCRRTGPGLFFDGQPIQCVTLPGAEFCDNCERATAISQSNNLSFLSKPVTSTNPKRFSPPKRSFDLFDHSPRIDLREHLFPLKRKRSSLNSSSSTISRTVESSPAKRVHFSDATLTCVFEFYLKLFCEF